MKTSVRIGCGAGFWGDSVEGPAQLVAGGALDYLVMDYLAEITMSILARMKARDEQAGYATDFISGVMKPLLGDIMSQRIRVVTNAGGINPAACAAALATLADALGLAPKIAVVHGDDLAALLDDLRTRDVREMTSGEALPERIASINAYLGATPIARALDAGADIVITGRCVDSALALGPLMHEFKWADDDYDRLAGGALAGHIIECGTQATGGLFTDWTSVPGWDDMGYPIAECRADGSFDITKPPRTGGLVTPATVSEQVVYEIGDPACYELPDVCCDFSSIAVRAVDAERVTVSGARGQPPSTTYKVCATWQSGYRATATMMIGGIDAAAKGQRVAESILARTRRLLARAGFADYRETSIEILGNESTYGPHARVRAVREVIVKLAVSHAERAALEVFSTEIYPAATAMAQGLTGFAGGRPAVQPIVRLFSCLVPKALADIEIELDGHRERIAIAPGRVRPSPPHPAPAPPAPGVHGATVPVPLLRLAHARSGDKGNSANIGVLARDPAFIPVLEAELSATRVAQWFAHCVAGPVTRYPWPGLNGFNFVLENALGGGGVASLRHDPQGKAYAQMLLDMPVAVPAAWTAEGAILGSP